MGPPEDKCWQLIQHLKTEKTPLKIMKFDINFKKSVLKSPRS